MTHREPKESPHWQTSSGGSMASFIKFIRDHLWTVTATVLAISPAFAVNLIICNGSAWTPYGFRRSIHHRWRTLATTSATISTSIRSLAASVSHKGRCCHQRLENTRHRACSQGWDHCLARFGCDLQIRLNFATGGEVVLKFLDSLF